jgi:hypothetical protein
VPAAAELPSWRQTHDEALQLLLRLVRPTFRDVFGREICKLADPPWSAYRLGTGSHSGGSSAVSDSLSRGAKRAQLQHGIAWLPVVRGLDDPEPVGCVREEKIVDFMLNKVAGAKQAPRRRSGAGPSPLV